MIVIEEKKYILKNYGIGKFKDKLRIKDIKIKGNKEITRKSLNKETAKI